MRKRKIIATLMQFRRRTAKGFRILTYHSVRPSSAGEPSPYVVDLDRFARQMQFLAEQRYNVVSLSAAVGALRSTAPLPPKTLVLSFDDGYRDNLTYAAQILRPLGYRPVAFVCPDMFGCPPGRYGEFVALSSFLTRDEVIALMEAGWEIGGHTNTHRRLTVCRSRDELDREIAGCRATLQRLIGCDVATFAYPFGQFDDSVKAAARRNGFTAACSTIHGFNTASVDPFELRRISVCADDRLGDFKKKLVGAYDWLGYFDRRSLAQRP